jgi:hypothetical protein
LALSLSALGATEWGNIPLNPCEFPAFAKPEQLWRGNLLLFYGVLPKIPRTHVYSVSNNQQNLAVAV